MTYDSSRSRVVLFGGAADAGVTNELWEFDSTNWQNRATTPAPPASQHSAIAYDVMRGSTLLFTGAPLAQTWQWNGSAWSQASPAHSPPATENTQLVYDSARSEVLLIGTVSPPEALVTWEWNGSDWSNRSPSTLPPYRADFRVAWDQARRRAVLFGGFKFDLFPLTWTTFGDTWEWDGTTWVEREPLTVPSARNSYAMTYDSARQRVVMHGGSDDEGATLSGIFFYGP